MASALYCYSLVPRAQARHGATKAELIAAIYTPDTVAFHAAEEVFNSLTSDEEGLGALEVTDTASGRARYHLAVTQTLRMFFKQAKGAVQPEDRDAYLWDRTRALAQANQGHFDQVLPVAMPDVATAPRAVVFADVDQNSKTRLVVLDPRRWTLLNGRDTPTRGDIAALLGVGQGAIPVDNAASCVIACVNTQRRDAVRKRATEVLAWRSVLDQLDAEDEKRPEAAAELRAATERVDADLLKAFQHYAYVTRTDKVDVDWKRFDDDTPSGTGGDASGIDAGPTGGRGGRPSGSSGGAGGTTARGGAYRRYSLEVPNRSLVDPEARRALANLFQAVLDTIDPDTGGDVQLLDLQLNLTADTAAVEEIEQRASGAEASWQEEELDF